MFLLLPLLLGLLFTAVLCLFQQELWLVTHRRHRNRFPLPLKLFQVRVPMLLSLVPVSRPHMLGNGHPLPGPQIERKQKSRVLFLRPRTARLLSCWLLPASALQTTAFRRQLAPVSMVNALFGGPCLYVKTNELPFPLLVAVKLDTLVEVLLLLFSPLFEDLLRSFQADVRRAKLPRRLRLLQLKFLLRQLLFLLLLRWSLRLAQQLRLCHLPPIRLHLPQECAAFAGCRIFAPRPHFLRHFRPGRPVTLQASEEALQLLRRP
mmetsp:Transcript_7777/g.19948  ORF Transcript_7777/g.19948 Transcript_7777/m.19948 type:complete len:263 (+) Transcript_7777:2170-2958(+)